MRNVLCLLLTLLTGAFLLASGCRSDERKLPTIQTDIPFRTDGRLAFLESGGDTLATIDIEIADNDQSRARGLMGRRSLPRRGGMLFIMDTSDTTGFWMRNTPLPLDVVFVGADSQVVSIAKRTTPYSDETILPAGPKKYVVEVRAGFSDRFGISDSARITWVRTAAPAG